MTAKFVVLENCGYERERQVFGPASYDDCDTAYYELYTDSEREELHVSIMLIQEDGTLTTEF